MITKVLLGLFVAIPFSLMNFNAYLKGGMPSIVNILGTIIFLLVWVLWGYYSSRKNGGISKFIKFSTAYWGLALVLAAVTYVLDAILFAIPVVFLFLGPLYGLKYFFNSVSYEVFSLICIIMGYAFSLIGSFVGYRVSRTFKGV